MLVKYIIILGKKEVFQFNIIFCNWSYLKSYLEIPRPPMGQKPRGKWKHWELPHFQQKNRSYLKISDNFLMK